MLFLPLIAGLASAAPSDAAWSVDLGLGSELPVQAGLQGVVELPGRLRVGASLGRVPSVVLNGATGIASAAGVLDADSESALHDSLLGSRVLGASLGWRPFARSGLWLTGDYRSVRVNASAGTELLEAAFDLELGAVSTGELALEPALGQAVQDPFSVSFRAQLVGGTIGHDWVLADRLVFRLSAGAVGLVGGTTWVEAGESAPENGPEQAAADQADEELDGLYAPRFLSPTVGLGIAWRFGGRPSA